MAKNADLLSKAELLAAEKRFLYNLGSYSERGPFHTHEDWLRLYIAAHNHNYGDLEEWRQSAVQYAQDRLKRTGAGNEIA